VVFVEAVFNSTRRQLATLLHVEQVKRLASVLAR
jgi:hypothetical protein